MSERGPVQDAQEATSGGSLGPLAVVMRLGTAGFVAFVIVLHFVSSDFDPSSRFVSEYVLGDYPWLMRLAFFSLAAAFAAAALMVPRALPARRRTRVVSVLLWVTAVGIFLSGVFGSDPIDVEEASTSGALHDLAGILGFIALMIAVFQLRRLFADSPGWASRARPQLWFALGMLVLFLVMLFSPEDIVGISQRVFLIVTMTWLIVLSGWLSSTRLPSGAEQTT